MNDGRGARVHQALEKRKGGQNLELHRIPEVLEAWNRVNVKQGPGSERNSGKL